MTSFLHRQCVLVLDGTIGSGKSTAIDALMKLYKNDSRVKFVHEQVDAWEKYGLLKGLYDGTLDKSMFQACALMPQVIKLYDALRTPGVQVVVTERSPWSNASVFAEINLDPVHLNAYNYLYEGTMELLNNCTFDLSFAFLDVPVDVAAKRMADRARGSEKGVPRDYLVQLDMQHREFLQRIHDKMLPLHEAHTLHDPIVIPLGAKNDVVEALSQHIFAMLSLPSPVSVADVHQYC